MMDGLIFSPLLPPTKQDKVLLRTAQIQANLLQKQGCDDCTVDFDVAQHGFVEI